MFVLLCVFSENFSGLFDSLASIAYGMVKDAEDKGLITPGKVETINSRTRFAFFLFKIKLKLKSLWIYSRAY